MICPSCSYDDAYVGFSSVDCLNPECRHFREEYLEAKLAESKHKLDTMISGLGLTEAWYAALLDMYD